MSQLLAQCNKIVCLRLIDIVKWKQSNNNKHCSCFSFVIFNLVGFGFTTFRKQNVSLLLSQCFVFHVIKANEQHRGLWCRSSRWTWRSVWFIQSQHWYDSLKCVSTCLQWLKSYLLGRLFCVIVLNVSWWSNEHQINGCSHSQLESSY